MSELLAAVIGGPRQIEIAEELLALFQGDLRRLYQAHPAELARHGRAARERALAEFSIDAMVARYRALYRAGATAGA